MNSRKEITRMNIATVCQDLEYIEERIYDLQCDQDINVLQKSDLLAAQKHVLDAQIALHRAIDQETKNPV